MVGGLAFSPDGRRYAYAGGQAGKQMLVVDGKAYKPFDGLAEIAFSPDGHASPSPHRPATSGPRWWTARRQPPTKASPPCSFSPDSQRLAFVAGADGRQVIVADGREGPPFDGVTAVTFSPDSRRLAYLAVDRLGKFLVVDGRRIGPAEAFAFSPDGRHVVRTIRYLDGHWGLGVDGTAPEVRYAGFPVGGQIAFDGPDAFRVVAARGNDLVRIDAHIR